VFIGAWSTTKIPLVLFEVEAMGVKFALTRLALNIPGILIIAWTLSALLSDRQIQEIYSLNTEKHI
jgi:hypothetical protein